MRVVVTDSVMKPHVAARIGCDHDSPALCDAAIHGDKSTPWRLRCLARINDLSSFEVFARRA